MIALGATPHLFLGEQEIVGSDHPLPQGQVCVRSLRSPDKLTPNEDAAAVIPVADGSLVLAVADGVGGTPAGREASNLAVATLASKLGALPADVAQLRTAILDAVEEANRAVLGIGRGAATTLVVAQIHALGMRCYHVGDSELLVTGQRGRIKQRVVPHSPTGFAVEAGLLDEEEAIQHEQRHVLFNVIGSPDMRVEIGAELKLAQFDTLLLASDGLFDNLFLDEIVDSIRKGPIEAAADRLVERARARMEGAAADRPCKPDDLTVVLYRPAARNGQAA